MSNPRSEEAFVGFLDFLARKGLVKTPTVRARKAASRQVLSVLHPEEKQDLAKIDVDEVMQRFANLKGTDYAPRSLQTYRSRFSSALSDFLRYTENPANFKPEIAHRTSRSGGGEAKGDGTTRGRRRRPPPSPPPISSEDAPVPVRIRPNVIVELRNIPHDFTTAEARKVAAVVKALAGLEDQK